MGEKDVAKISSRFDKPENFSYCWCLCVLFIASCRYGFYCIYRSSFIRRPYFNHFLFSCKCVSYFTFYTMFDYVCVILPEDYVSVCGSLGVRDG